ncbi:MAG: hypothetical protein AAFR81_21130 [Chloroflexota bacterium]
MSEVNYFQLATPNKLSCRVDKYWTGHGELLIRVTNRGLFVVYLHFYDVQYLSAPMNWKSADFQTGASSEVQKLLEDMGYPKKMARDDSQDYYKLYTVKRSKIPIQILSRGVEKIDYDILANTT